MAEKEIKMLDIYPSCVGCPYLDYCGLSVSCNRCCHAVREEDKKIYEQRRSI